MNEQTRYLHLGEEENERYYHAVVPPIFQTSLFTSPTYADFVNTINHRGMPYYYTRYGNPNLDILGEKIADLEQGDGAVLTASGLSAITTAILTFVKTGGHIVAIRHLYGPTRAFLSYLEEKMQVQVTYVSGCDLDEFASALRDNTTLVMLESPTSFLFLLQDLRAVANLCRERGIVTLIDNSYSSPLLQKPLACGIDLVIHSATKYLSGHSDTIGGVIVANQPHLAEIRRQHKLLGTSMAPFDAWLILRGMRTLDVRLERHAKNAMAVALFLENHDKVKRVYYPALPSCSQYDLAQAQMSGCSGLLSFEIDAPKERMPFFFDALRVAKIGLSWGGYESIVNPIKVGFGKEFTEEQFSEMGITDGLVRLHVGLEHVEDIIEDLKSALEKL